MTDDCGCGRRAAPLLFLSAGEAGEQQTVVEGGLVRLLDVKASVCDILATEECPALAKAGQASGGGTIKVSSSIPEMAVYRLFLSACEASNCGWLSSPEARCAAAVSLCR